ncbi:hypothetical protein RFI_29846 [Reticulomyxa filosa]|uniref:Uncharacterized protein n=1 Tax=Reticulomyxa filosa TaxID=46433 RepID=X6M2A6_RETFI|nr:hypothetical protein RFI_29846 [Reticulomyxa filosa]|eukprot:ETO07547.1 hypothetical protein RFI_29846 [Reticulomyxa filosa]
MLLDKRANVLIAIGDNSLVIPDSNPTGNIDTNDNNNDNDICKIITHFHNIARIQCGFNHTLLLTRNNELYGFGSNACYEISFDKKFSQLITVPILMCSLHHQDTCHKIVIGCQNTFLICNGGEKIYVYGADEFGQTSFQWGQKTKDRFELLDQRPLASIIGPHYKITDILPLDYYSIIVTSRVK